MWQIRCRLRQRPFVILTHPRSRASNHPPHLSHLEEFSGCQTIAHRGIWVEPTLLAEIEYRAKSAEGKVRHPVFKGLREDL